MRWAADKTEAVDVRAVLKEALARLREARVPSHTLAAELLLMHVLGRERAWLYAHPEEFLDADIVERYFALVARRISGVPTQYLTGRQEFWGLEFEVTPDVLIPRPETEHVVEVALARLGRKKTREQHTVQGDEGQWPASLNGTGLRLADVGTGSGCLAVALARELPAAHVTATDISAAALAVARRNAVRHGVGSRVDFVLCNLLDAVLRESQTTTPQSRRFDLIVSNPPYVGRNEEVFLPREVRSHEPHTALFGGEGGLDLYAPLVHQAENLLPSGGLLILELGYNALLHVQSLFTAARWTEVDVTHDLAGIPRVLAAERT